MSVNTDDTRIAKTAGNGTLVDFDFAFKIFAATDLTCYKVSAAGVYTLGVLNGAGATGYTVDFDTEEETGTVTWNTAPVSSGFSVIIGDALEQTQTSHFPREGVTPAATLKNAYDKLTLLIQQLTERVSRSPLQPLTPVNPEPIEIAAPVDAKGLLWQDNGDGTWDIVSSDDDLNDIVTDAEAAQTAAAASQAAAAASATAAAASAAAAAASAGSGSGLWSARPAAPTQITFYYSTDRDSLELWIPVAARWFLIG